MRILIADNRPKVRFALRVALEQRPGDKTISEAADADDLLAQTNVICPDLILTDWELPGIPMAELVPQLRRTCVNLRVVVLHSREETRGQAIAAGADAFVSKCDGPDELLAAIDQSLKADQVIPGNEQPGQDKLQATESSSASRADQIEPRVTDLR